METNSIITFLACVTFLFIFGKVFAVPLIKILKLIMNSLLGALLIYVINFIGSVFSFHIGLNIVTSIIIGFLGIPGAILLVIIKMLIG